LKAATSIHYHLLNNVLHLPISTFFDVTPIGRILARFSVSVVDLALPSQVGAVLPCLFRVSKLFG
jgi:hypothetical protein